MIRIKEYDFLTNKQNELVNEDLTRYLTKEQKAKILNLFNMNTRAKHIATLINEPSFVVLQYLVKELGEQVLEIEKNEYLSLSKGQKDYGSLYLFFNDLYQLRRSKYVYCKELKISPQSLKYPYVLHHINYPPEGSTLEEIQDNKLNDNILNLYLAKDYTMHRAIHLEGVKSIEEIEVFTNKYINEELQRLEELYSLDADIDSKKSLLQEIQELKKYFRIVTKQIELQKRKILSSSGIPESIAK